MQRMEVEDPLPLRAAGAVHQASGAYTLRTDQKETKCGYSPVEIETGLQRQIKCAAPGAWTAAHRHVFMSDTLW
jgi:hypothetical protein